jgi:hypothetical protein
MMKLAVLAAALCASASAQNIVEVLQNTPGEIQFCNHLPSRTSEMTEEPPRVTPPVPKSDLHYTIT